MSEQRVSQDPEAGALAGSEADATPVATVCGVPFTDIPRGLYIPPDALEVFLETFEGPLDLLLYLIKRQNLNVLDIPIAQVTQQYIVYVDLMMSAAATDSEDRAGPDETAEECAGGVRFELVAEYLVMAAILAEIKSRMLLPRPPADNEETDPRAELVRRLQEYARFKQAAESLDGLPRIGRDILELKVVASGRRPAQLEPPMELPELLFALQGVLTRAAMFSHHQVRLEPLSVRDRMARILAAVRREGFTEFTAFFTAEEGRRGVVVTLLAVLELVKESLIELVQIQPFAPIYVKAAG
ncbi:MAG: segregation and condensation protein A [Gammaproteobacteria bacterium]